MVAAAENAHQYSTVCTNTGTKQTAMATKRPMAAVPRASFIPAPTAPMVLDTACPTMGILLEIKNFPVFIAKESLAPAKKF